jgi:uncharacterized protein (DUF342 family)
MGSGFRLTVNAKGLFLEVTPDAEVSLAEIASYLREREIEEYDGQAVVRALQERPPEPVRIGDRRTELDRKAELQIRIAEDGLEASLRLFPPLGSPPWPTIEGIRGFLREHGVVEGHDEGAIADMVARKIVRQWVSLAKGRPPKNGKDAAIEYKINLHSLRPKEVSDGSRVDMRDLGTVVNVLKGQELAEKSLPVPGEDGMSVLGKPIRAYQGKDKGLPQGSGTLLSEDRLHLFADVDGHVTVKDGKLTVQPLFEVKGDLDYSVGNVQFVGPVSVKGAVREGFEVSAGGDLFVEGVVEGATLRSNENIHIRIGVRGIGKAQIVAKKDVIVGYVDQAKVRAGGDIRVTEAILHSDVGARGMVVVAGSKKGQIVGGRIQAGSEVVCEILGSEMGTRTDVVVGVFPELLEERRRLGEALKEMQDKLREVETNLGYIKKIESAGQLDEQKRGILLRLTKAKFQLQAQIALIGEKSRGIEVEVERNKASGKIRVRNVCHPGVVVTIRGLTYIVRETLRFCCFAVEEGEVKIKAFDY